VEWTYFSQIDVLKMLEQIQESWVENSARSLPLFLTSVHISII